MAVPSSGPPLLLYLTTCPHALSAVGATRIMLACADQELCKLPNRPLGEKDGHECRLGIKAVEATMEDRTATVTFEDTLTSIEAIQQATANIGYPSSLYEQKSGS